MTCKYVIVNMFIYVLKLILELYRGACNVHSLNYRTICTISNFSTCMLFIMQSCPLEKFAPYPGMMHVDIKFG